MRRVVCTSAALLLLGAFPCAQFKGDVVLINVVATVVDGKGRTVPNLTIDDFILEEDAQPQTIKHLLPAADLPVSIGVLLDASKSMTPAGFGPGTRARRLGVADDEGFRERVDRIVVGIENEVLMQTVDLREQ